jgi:hypothetical protein
VSSESYRAYLQSDDWKRKRQEKRRKKNHCAICGDTRRLDVHHLRYQADLRKVPKHDLRVLCRTCHTTAHDLMKAGVIVFKSEKHNHRFAVTCRHVRAARGITAWCKDRPPTVTAPVEREAPPEVIGPTMTGLWLVTKAWIEEYRTPKGGWKAKQLAAIGIDWPPLTGWKTRAAGTTISQDQRLTFEAFARTK